MVKDIDDDLALKRNQFSAGHRLLKPLLARLRPYSDIPRVFDASEVVSCTLTSAENHASHHMKLQKLGWADLGDKIVDYLVQYSKVPNSSVSPRIIIDTADDNISESLDMSGVVSEARDDPVAMTYLEANNIQSDIQMANATDDLLDQAEVSELAVQSATPMARKRSTDSAGLPEAAEGGRSRSKRIRARESVAENAHAADNAGTDLVRQSEYLQESYLEADNVLFDTIGEFLDRINLQGPGSAENLRKLLETDVGKQLGNEEGQSQQRDYFALIDLNNILHNCTEDLAQILIQRDMMKQIQNYTNYAHLQASAVLDESAKANSLMLKDLVRGANLMHLLKEVNSNSMVIEEVSWTFLLHLLGNHNLLALKTTLTNIPASSYLMDHWPSDLKSDVLKILFYINDFLYSKVDQRISALEDSMLVSKRQNLTYSLNEEDHAWLELVQTIFELHLDLLTVDVKNGNEKVFDADLMKRQYMNRWAMLCQKALAFYLSSTKDSDFGILAFRFAWACALHLKASEDITDRQMILFLQELKNIMKQAQVPALKLPNNNSMPELSLVAIEEEVTVLSLKDLFTKIYEDADLEDPISLIETLEPVLDYPTQIKNASKTSAKSDGFGDADSDSSREIEGNCQEVPKVEGVSLQQASDYIQKSKLLLRLSLWHRLGEAYEAIDFVSKTVACRFRIIEHLRQELQSIQYLELPEVQRKQSLLNWLGIMDQQLLDVVNIVRKEPQLTFEFIDEALLRSALSSIVTISRLLYVYMLYDDKERLKSPQTSSFPRLTASLSTKMRTFFQDMQTRAWVLFYYLMQETKSQYREAFDDFDEERSKYLRAVHYAMGVRGTCKQSKMAFLRLEKQELLALRATEQIDLELSQVLYDLYGLKTFTNPIDCTDHNTSSETIDKKVALSILDFMLRQIKKGNIKELHRTELKASVDRVNMAIGRQKPNDSLVRNRKLFNAHIKSLINPLDLYRCLDGSGALSTVPIPPQLAPIASRGWYFIMGNLSLNKYRSQKRLTSGPTEELNAAITFFAQDIEYWANNWESWYRIAQAYDFQVEELVLWSAEKMNSNSSDLISFQRSAIHSYVMATACAVRSSEQSSKDQSVIAEMYFDFGMRIYASSRPPFSMEAFKVKDSEQRYISGSTTFKAKPFSELHHYTAWKFAAALFKRALALKPNSWM